MVDMVFMPQGLHNEPDKLREDLQKVLLETTDELGNAYDAILLGYGLCSNGIVGLSCDIPVVVCRAHDCITLLLGSKDKYKDYFDSHRGIYWYSPGWVECGEQPSQEKYERLLAQYTEKYGEDNAQYLLEVEQTWMKEYSRAVYVDWGIIQSDKYKAFTKECAKYLGWDYDEIKGDPDLMQRLIDGKWSKEEFLVIEPGQKIAQNLTCSGIIKAQ